MKVLYLMSTLNLYGGTPKKTLDLIRGGKQGSLIYFWSEGAQDNKNKFVDAGATVFEGYGKSFIAHIREIISIVDEQSVDIIQVQFTYGELIAWLVKLLRPDLKVIVAFVGPFSPLGIKKFLLNLAYKKIDHFVYVSNYVKEEKCIAFDILKSKPEKVIYNGSANVTVNREYVQKSIYTVVDVAGLVDWKNIRILIKAFDILVNNRQLHNVKLKLVGDGPQRKELELLINNYCLNDNVCILGYRQDVQKILENGDIFAHPAYAEGFGIAVAEAMHNGLPVLVSNMSALPELVVNNESGLILPFDDAESWADAIKDLVDDEAKRKVLGIKARTRANEIFSIDTYSESYYELYRKLLQ